MANLATLAFDRSKKVSKSRAMIVIEALAASHPDKIMQLSELYSYFKPTVPFKPKTAEDWVCKAVAKNDVRLYLNRLEVLDGWLIATDGHRLHMCKTTLENGAYDTQLNPIRAIGGVQFPNVKKVIPKHELNTTLGGCRIVRHLTSAKNEYGTTVHGNWVEVKFDDETKICFSTKYWNDATCGFEDDATVKYPDQPGAILIENKKRRCVLMAVKIK